MTPRERVLTALKHQQPDRVPFSWGFGPTPEMTVALQKYLKAQNSDWPTLRQSAEHINYVGADYTGPKPPPHCDMWGVQRKPQSYGTGKYDEIERYPLAGFQTPDEAEAYPWPDPEDYDYASAREKTLAAHPKRHRATKCFGGNPLEIYSWMTGLEETLINFLVNPELVVTCLEYITGYFEARLRRTLEKIGDFVDIVFIADDLGGQQGLLISREKYREILQPFHRRLCETSKELSPNCKVMFHSDGSVFEILPDLIDAGVDILEAVQVDAAKMDPAGLKQTYGNQISFHGGISVQQLLPQNDAAKVARECRRLVEVFGKGGGYIAAPTHAIQMGTPPENVPAMLKSVFGDEEYQGLLEAARVTT